MRVAVVGSGIAGLAAVRNLRRLNHHITIYEQLKDLGASAHKARVAGSSGHGGIDVPLRITSTFRWPALSELAADVGAEMMPTRLDSSYSDLDGPTHFLHEKQGALFGKALTVPVRMPTWEGVHFFTGIARFRYYTRSDLHLPATAAMTFEEWLNFRRFRPEFKRLFVYPTLRLSCTCSQAAIEAFPAPVLMEFMDSVFYGDHHFQRFRFGTADIAERLAERADAVRLGRPIRSVEQEGEQVVVIDEGGEQERYDHVVLATQAFRAAEMLGQREAEVRGLLRRFPYEKGEMVVHTDDSLMPRDRRGWTAFNYIAAKDRVRSMSTVWTNPLEPAIVDCDPIFQTWNPLHEPAEGSVIMRVPLDRPVVTLDSYAALDQLLAIGDRPDRRISICGTYAAKGMPLLETAVLSANRICERLGPARAASDPAA